MQLNYRSRVGGNFELIHNSQNWNLEENGKPMNLLYFGYTKCPDVCPLTMSFASLAFRELSAKDLQKVQFIFVNLDFAHDKLENVEIYVTQFFADFIALTGTSEQIDKVINLFETSFTVEKNPQSYLGYSIAHPDRIFILNKNGILLDSILSPRSKEEVLNKIREHL
jgi:protein SCO1/2